MTDPGLPPVETKVWCGTEQHRLRWEAGVLTALDHDDVDGELALAGLGGAPVACARIVADWRAAQDDLRVLVIGSRGDSDRLNTPADHGPFRTMAPHVHASGPGYASTMTISTGTAAVPAVFPGAMPGRSARGSMRAGGRTVAQSAAMVTSGGPPGGFGWFAYAPLGAVAHQPEPLTGLFMLGGGMPERLVATVIATWTARLAEGGEPPGARPALVAALVSRAQLALRTWYGDPSAAISVTMLPPGGAPTLVLEDGVLTAGLPFSWLATVWVPRLTTLLGRFTLAATRDEAGTDYLLDTVGPQLDRGQLRIQLP